MRYGCEKYRFNREPSRSLHEDFVYKKVFDGHKDSLGASCSFNML